MAEEGLSRNGPIALDERVLTRAYSEQLGMLKEGLQRIPGMTFFPRLKVLIAPDAHRDGIWPYDPGFGTGRFSWPDIDRPPPEQAAWNAAVRARVVRMSLSGHAELHAQTEFQATSVADSQVDFSYHIKSANERFISVDINNLTYDYGAAHPNWYTISFQWWLQRRRALKAEDVFRPESGWVDFLARRCYEKLISGDHAKYLFDPKTVREAALDSVKQVKYWTIGATKFKIAFPDYSVGPHSAGRVFVELDWQELKPYLAAGFDPAELPLPF